jgi:hypothetical protein
MGTLNGAHSHTVTYQSFTDWTKSKRGQTVKAQMKII